MPNLSHAPPPGSTGRGETWDLARRDVGKTLLLPKAYKKSEVPSRCWVRTSSLVIAA